MNNDILIHVKIIGNDAGYSFTIVKAQLDYQVVGCTNLLSQRMFHSIYTISK